MYNCPKIEKPEHKIFDHHMAVLKEAVYDADRYDIRCAPVYDAIDYIARTRPWVKWHCAQFKRAIEEWSPEHMMQTFQYIEEKTKRRLG